MHIQKENGCQAIASVCHESQEKQIEKKRCVCAVLSA